MVLDSLAKLRGEAGCVDGAERGRKLLGVGDARVRQWALWGAPWGELRSTKIGNRRVYDRADIDDFIRRRASHYERRASEGRVLPPGVRWPVKPKGES